MAQGVATAITKQALVCLLTAWLPTGREAPRRDSAPFVYFPDPRESLADSQYAANVWHENDLGSMVRMGPRMHSTPAVGLFLHMGWSVPSPTPKRA